MVDGVPGFFKDTQNLPGPEIGMAVAGCNQLTSGSSEHGSPVDEVWLNPGKESEVNGELGEVAFCCRKNALRSYFL